MVRPLRIEYPGALYHVTTRGNARKNIFLDERDRHLFLAMCERLHETHHVMFHAYCLMNNHYHLLLETPEGNLSSSMRQLNGLYTQRFHFRHGTVGHIFQGRYHAVLVDKESYFLAVARYIVLNPVRAKLVTDPRRYPWSSYAATAGYRRVPLWLNTSDTLGRFSKTQRHAEKEYRAFVCADAGIRSPLRDMKNGVLAAEPFFLELTKGGYVHELRKEVSKENRMLGRPFLADIFRELDTRAERNSGIVLAVCRCAYSAAEVARHLGLHYSTVSKIVDRNSRFKT